jgi:predicted small secreted protein
MKRLVILTLSLGVVVMAGCAANKVVQKKSAPAPAPAQPIVTPDNSLAATVLMFNPVGRFVVLNFPTGNLPKRDQVLFVYHGGLKAGEVKITGPEHDFNVVADLTTGAAQSGDEVRDQ